MTARANLQHIKDIFNAVSERLEKLTHENQLDKLLLYLRALGIFVGNYVGQERI